MKSNKFHTFLWPLPTTNTNDSFPQIGFTKFSPADRTFANPHKTSKIKPFRPRMDKGSDVVCRLGSGRLYKPRVSERLAPGALPPLRVQVAG